MVGESGSRNCVINDLLGAPPYGLGLKLPFVEAWINSHILNCLSPLQDLSQDLLQTMKINFRLHRTCTLIFDQHFLIRRSPAAPSPQNKFEMAIFGILQLTTNFRFNNFNKQALVFTCPQHKSFEAFSFMGKGRNCS